MNKDEALGRLQQVFDRVFIDKVKVTSELTADQVPEWDSLTHISLMVAVEKAFAVRFQTGEAETAKTVGEFADLIVKKIEGK